MLVNERVMTMADSSPAGETSIRSVRAASGLRGRQVTAIVGWPSARARVATSTASDVEPERDTITIGWRAAGPPRTPPRAEEQLGQGNRGRDPAAELAGHRRGDLGEVVRRAGPGEHDPIGRVEHGREVALGRPGRGERGGDRLVGGGCLAPRAEVVERRKRRARDGRPFGHRSRRSRVRS